jgi:aminoglycoside phosphotransferase (APT) family kinase protein
MTESVDRLRDFLDGRLGDSSAIVVEAMVGGGSCDIFGVQRGRDRWVLRRAPRHASSATAHDVLREFRILDAIKDEAVPIARPLLACDDPDVFGATFYVMARIDGVPVRAGIPSAWTTNPREQSQALDQLVDALVAIHAVDWQQRGLRDLAHSGPYLARQVDRWMSQLDSYHARPLPSAARVASWLDDHRPADQVLALAHGDYKLDNVLFAPDAPPHLLAVVDWEMASIGDPLIDLAWAMVFHPGPEGTIPLGVSASPGFDRSHMPTRSSLLARYAERSGRDIGGIDWYHVFARWKLAIVLEGSYAKFLRGESKKAVHEFFGKQTDLLLESAIGIVEEH